MSSIKAHTLYNIEPDKAGKGYSIHLTSRNGSKRDRMSTVIFAPPEAHLRKDMSPEEWESFGWHLSTHGQVISIIGHASGEEVKNHFNQYNSPEVNESLGLQEKLEELRAILAFLPFKNFCDGSRHGPHIKYRGNANDISLSIQSGHHENGIGLGRPARKALESGNEDYLARLTRLNQLVGEVALVYNDRVFGSDLKVLEILERDWYIMASLTLGHHDQHMVTGGQMSWQRFPEPGEEKNDAHESLKSRSKGHVDMHDCPIRISYGLNLSNGLPADYSPGHFLLNSGKVAFPTLPLSSASFSGRLPHQSTGYGYYAEDTPEENRYKRNLKRDCPENLSGDQHFKGSIKLIMYCSHISLRARHREVHPDLWDERKALVHFGTALNYCEWKMRMAVKAKAMENLPSLISQVTSEESFIALTYDLITTHTWTHPTTSQITYPRREIVEKALKYSTMGYLNERGENTDPKYLRLYEAAMESNCGSAIENDKEVGSDDYKRLEADRRSRALRKMGRSKVRCRGFKSNMEGCTRVQYEGFCHHHRSQAQGDVEVECGGEGGGGDGDRQGEGDKNIIMNGVDSGGDIVNMTDEIKEDVI